VLSKTKSVLKLHIVHDERSSGGVGYAFFSVELDQDNPKNIFPKYDMEISKWEEMGKPEVITLSAEPGDTLNPKITGDENG
jgi:hypothetical protein